MNKLLLFCLLLVLSSFSASAQYFQWAKKQENSYTGTSVASSNSLVATTGTFTQTITLGNQTFTKVDTMGHYLAVYDHAGNVLWARHIIDGQGFGQQPVVTIDANQNIILAGSFIDSLHIGSLIFKRQTTNTSGAFVAKFSPTGTLLWARSSVLPPNTGYAAGKSVTTDMNGNVIVAGDFSNTVTFNGTTLTANGSSDAFIVKYDASGAFQWATNSPNTTEEYVTKVKAASNGDVYLLNFTQNQTAFNRGFAILKISNSGNLLWNKTISGSGSKIGRASCRERV